MPITRKGPGNPGKVASKMTKTSTGKLKNVFTNISAKMKAEQAGRDQVKKYKESLKQKKLAEQKAQKDLQLKERGGQRGKMSVSKEVKVKPKGKGGGYLSLGGMTRQKMSALPAMDSATFVNTIRNAPASPKSGLPFTGSAGQKYGANSKDMAMRQMKAAQKKYGPGTRFKDFKYDKQTGSYVFTAY